MDAYHQAIARLQEFDERENANIAPESRSAFYGHGERTHWAIVLYHGLSATPRQFSQLAAQLAARGYTVIVPRLPRHGYADRMTFALADLQRDHLVEAIDESLAVARLAGERVAVIGFSMGGLLATWAAQFRGGIDHVTTIAPFLGIIGFPHEAERHLAQWARSLPNVFMWWDPVARERQKPEHGYPRYSTHALATCQRLAHEVMNAAAVARPASARLLVVTNARESSVNNRTIAKLVRRWRAHGARVDVHVFRHLPPSHDIIEPMRRPRLSRWVNPSLMALVSGALHRIDGGSSKAESAS